ncbi:ATP-grasp domain-containing protein [Streptomyces sp. SCUT-3]|uniref:ATP-binding protein n=1 Tax=Streptomyces sp. SCUT-3 TaxID=2684469 RepID=UPI0015FE2586|nr:ATP-grasp domain-containing protein [Streptomyces sp. SCUT-3]QMV23048.1 ATP-grasp domain-containing protein [Streptomyces sp. SCUT-3]
MTDLAVHTPGRPQDAPVLLLVGSGYRPYREYILAAVSKHYRLWLLDSAEATWQLAYCAGATRVDTRDAEAVREAAAGRRGLPAGRGRLHLRRDAGRLLRPPRAGPRAAGQPARGRHQLPRQGGHRAALAAAGVPQPASRTVATAEEALAAAEEIGYPVIVKARAMAASFGVVRADGPGDVAAAFATADGTEFMNLPRYPENVLVEEFLTGPEISVDASSTTAGHADRHRAQAARPGTVLRGDRARRGRPRPAPRRRGTARPARPDPPRTRLRQRRHPLRVQADPRRPAPG